MPDNDLSPVPDPALPSAGASAFAPDLDAAIDFARKADAANTRRAYEAAWRDFSAYCMSREREALPADPITVAAYLAYLAPKVKAATLSQRLAAISRRHRDTGHHLDTGHPAIRETRRGIRATHGSAVDKAAAIMLDDIQRLVRVCPHDLVGHRDRAMILLGFAAALRRAELVAVDHEDIRFTTSGLTLVVQQSKTDQDQKGEDIGVPRGRRPETDPVAAVETWIREAKIEYGPLFRKISQRGILEPYALHPDSVRRILARRAEEAGLQAVNLGGRISPHGLRSGFITEAYAKGLRDEEIMAHTRHSDLRVMRGYVRRARLLTDSPAGRIGL